MEPDFEVTIAIARTDGPGRDDALAGTDVLPERAFANFRRAADGEPLDSDYVYILGTALADRGRHAEAAAAFQDAIALDRSQASYLVALGASRWHLRSYDDAATAFEEALALAPGDARRAERPGRRAARTGPARGGVGRARAGGRRVARRVGTGGERRDRALADGRPGRRARGVAPRRAAAFPTSSRSCVRSGGPWPRRASGSRRSRCSSASRDSRRATRPRSSTGETCCTGSAARTTPTPPTRRRSVSTRGRWPAARTATTPAGRSHSGACGPSSRRRGRLRPAWPGPSGGPWEASATASRHAGVRGWRSALSLRGLVWTVPVAGAFWVGAVLGPVFVRHYLLADDLRDHRAHAARRRRVRPPAPPRGRGDARPRGPHRRRVLLGHDRAAHAHDLVPLRRAGLGACPACRTSCASTCGRASSC